MMDHLSPGLILLQFGGNVVPYMNPGYYRQAFKEELEYLQGDLSGCPSHRDRAGRYVRSGERKIYHPILDWSPSGML